MRVILNAAKSEITPATQQPTHLIGRMIVVHIQSCSMRRTTARGANTLLVAQHSIILRSRDSVVTMEIVNTVPFFNLLGMFSSPHSVITHAAFPLGNTTLPALAFHFKPFALVSR